MIKKFIYNNTVERARLVTNFNNLETGNIIWISPCRICKKSNRHILMNKYKQEIYNLSTYIDEYVLAFDLLPGICEGTYLALASNVVEEKRVYCVINPIEDIHNEIVKELVKNPSLLKKIL